MAGGVHSDVEENGNLLLDSAEGKKTTWAGLTARVAMVCLASGLLAMGAMTDAGKTVLASLREVQMKSSIPVAAESYWAEKYEACSPQHSHECKVYLHRQSEAKYRREAAGITPDVTSCTPKLATRCRILAAEWSVWEKLAELEAAAASLQECLADYAESQRESQCASQIKILAYAEKAAVEAREFSHKAPHTGISGLSEASPVTAETTYSVLYNECSPKSSHKCKVYMHRSSEARFRRKSSDMDPDVTSCAPKLETKCKMLAARWKVFEKEAEFEAALATLEECQDWHPEMLHDTECSSQILDVEHERTSVEEAKAYAKRIGQRIDLQ